LAEALDPDSILFPRITSSDLHGIVKGVEPPPLPMTRRKALPPNGWPRYRPSTPKCGLAHSPMSPRRCQITPGLGTRSVRRSKRQATTT
jgi:hypothetical protein